MCEDIEDITWPLGDMKFLLLCWKIFHDWVQRTSEIFFNTQREFKENDHFFRSKKHASTEPLPSSVEWMITKQVEQ